MKLFLPFIFMLTGTAHAIPSIYNIQVKTISGNPVDMATYKGKVLFVVNTASQCGFTPQLKDLETLYKKYKSKGLEVLAFPSNDFKQDPSSNSEILSYAKKNYEVSFSFFEKAPVTGPDKQAVYKFLTEQKKGVLFKEVMWNFEKFLVNRKGQVIERWGSRTPPTSDSVTKAIEKALAERP